MTPAERSRLEALVNGWPNDNGDPPDTEYQRGYMAACRDCADELAAELAGAGEADDPHLARIEGDDLVIRLPMAALITATEHCEDLATFDDEKGDYRKVKVTDPKAWMQGVVRELNSESDDGTTAVHLLFDKAFVGATDQGEEGIWIEGVHDD